MNFNFDLVHNHHEQAVYTALTALAPEHPLLAGDEDLLSDVACVALNRLPPRYIRHAVDFAFYLTEKERSDADQLVRESVRYAFEFVQARVAMRART